MKWSRAVHHVELAAQGCAHVAGLASAIVPLTVSQLWVLGELLGPPQDVESITLALVVDLPVAEVSWLSEPHGSDHWLAMARLSNSPIVRRWRSAHAPVWNHAIVGPLMVWDSDSGEQEGALDALREGRGAAAGLPEPLPEQRRARLLDELGVSFGALRARTLAYEQRRWGKGSLEPAADALWQASTGYLDVLAATS